MKRVRAFTCSNQSGDHFAAVLDTNSGQAMRYTIFCWDAGGKIEIIGRELPMPDVRRVIAEVTAKRRISYPDRSRSPLFCEHANETPHVCPCEPDCYCKTHTCRGEGPMAKRFQRPQRQQNSVPAPPRKDPMKPSEQVYDIVARVRGEQPGADRVDILLAAILEYLDDHGDWAEREAREIQAMGQPATVHEPSCDPRLALEAWQWLSGTHPCAGGKTAVERVAKAETCIATAVEWEPLVPRGEESKIRWASNELRQPDDGTGEDELFTLANEICGPLGRHAHGPAHDAEMALILERLRKARELGAKAARDDFVKRGYLALTPGEVRKALEELEEKLAAAEQCLRTMEEQGAPAASDFQTAERLAYSFHEAYERLAPGFGYETREESKKQWPEVPENNRQLMIAVADELLRRDIVRMPKALGPGDEGIVKEMFERISKHESYDRLVPVYKNVLLGMFREMSAVAAQKLAVATEAEGKAGSVPVPVAGARMLIDERFFAKPFTEREIDVMRHALGVQQRGGKWRAPYRNHFVAAGDSVAVWEGLVASGHARLVRKGGELSDGHPVFQVSEAGKSVALAGLEFG